MRTFARIFNKQFNMNASFIIDCEPHDDKQSALSRSESQSNSQKDEITLGYPHEKSKEEIKKVWDNYMLHKDSVHIKDMGYIRFEDPEQINNELLSYIEKVITIGDWAGKCRSSNTNEHYNWRSILAQQVPVRFVTRDQMPKPIFYGDFSMETLGCYFSLHPDTSYPLIFVCPDTIKETANHLPISEDILYAIVLIHEYAHAAMDPTNVLSEDGHFKKKGKQEELHEMELFIEESLANMLTLQYFEVAGDEDFAQVMTFMEKQPDAYKFGIDQYRLGTDWRDWRNDKSAFHFLSKWANVMKKCPIIA